RKGEGVVAAGGVHRLYRSVGGQAAGSAGQGLRYRSAIGQEEIECVGAVLRTRRRRGVLHEEILGDVEHLARGVGLSPQHQGLAADAVNLRGRVVDINVDAGGGRRNALEVIRALVRDVKQNLAAVRRAGAETALRVGGHLGDLV